MPQAVVEPLRESFPGMGAAQLAVAVPLYGRLLWEAGRLAATRATDSRGEIADEFRGIADDLEQGVDLAERWGRAGRADAMLTRAYTGRRGGSGAD